MPLIVKNAREIVYLLPIIFQHKILWSYLPRTDAAKLVRIDKYETHKTFVIADLRFLIANLNG